MKHEYLVELLKVNKTVIVPNLGAISNNENPHHPFLFNEYLKFNDGMMAKHIASKEGISMDAAGEMISKFTAEMQEILGAGKEVVIPGIGKLVKKDGKLHLDSPFEGAAGIKKNEPVISTPKVEEPKIIPPVVEKPKVEEPKIVPPVVEKKTEPIIEKKPEPKIVPPVVEKKAEETKIIPPKIEKPIVVPPVVEKKVEETKIVPPVIEKPKVEDVKIIPPEVEKKVEEIKVVTPVTEKKEDVVIPSIKSGQNPKQPEKIANGKSEKPKKKKKKLVWLILILLILGGGSTAGYLYKDELMKMMGMGGDTATASNEKDKKDSDGKSEDGKNNETENTTDENTVVEEPIAADSVAEATSETHVEEPIKVEEVVEDNKTQPITAESSTPGNYYIIVGCFQESTNADNMIAKISAAGMTPTNVGTFNGLAHIAAGSAIDLSAALQLASSIRGTFAKAWILKR